jgi:membrane-bound lytic murein transglycosylase B
MKNSYYMKIFLFTLLLIGIPASKVSAQTALPDVCKSPQTTEQKNQCVALQKEIDQLIKDEKKLSEQKNVTGSISNEVAALTADINKKKKDIAAKNKTLQQLSGQITEKVKSIQTLEQKRIQQEKSLAEVLRKKNQFDDYTLAEMMLSKKSLSEFFSEADQLETINHNIQNSFSIIKTTKQKTNLEKENLEDRRNKENDVKYALENQKKSVEVTQAEKNRTLAVSKGEEKNYEAVIKDRQARISSIRAELIKFQGSGIESRSVSFGEAYDYAKLASQKTGVDPAFVMAIMQQETGFGNNVGGCYVTDLTTGDGKSIKAGTIYEKVMGSGSLSYFEIITKALGLDWKTTPISCPIDIKGVGTATKYYSGRGYGGAMGYTQFIPSTWILVNERVQKNLGVSAANPWNPRDAIMATAVFIQDKGASGKASTNYSTYHAAACRYYGQCSSYATSVMNKAASIQKTIEQLDILAR